MPSLPPVSLTFVPNPSGVGGILVPKSGKSQGQSAPTSEFDSHSEEAGNLESDSNASSPVCLLPSTSFSTDRHKLAALNALPLPPACAFIKAETPAQTSTPYSSMNPASGLSTPNLSHSDSCMSETFLLNTASMSGHVSKPGFHFSSPPWHPTPASPQLNISSPTHQFKSSGSAQSDQHQVFPHAPPQLASLVQPHFPGQPQSAIQLPPPGGLSSPLCSGNSSFSCASSGVPSLAIGHPVAQEPSYANFLAQHPQTRQQGSTGPSFEFDFDLLSQSTLGMGSNLSMKSSTSSASLHESPMSDQMNFPLLGSFQGANLPPKSSRNCLRQSQSHPQGQAALQSSFTFVPAQCSLPTQYYQQPAPLHCHDLQSQVINTVTC